MKVISVALIFLLLFQYYRSKAQNTDEWVRQKKTQIRYLVQQIAGLQAYIELGREAYNIAEKGHQLVSDIKNGEFDLHETFFQSRYGVHPALKEILRYHGPCKTEYELLLRKDYYQLTPAERIRRIMQLRMECRF